VLDIFIDSFSLVYQGTGIVLLYVGHRVLVKNNGSPHFSRAPNMVISEIATKPNSVFDFR